MCASVESGGRMTNSRADNPYLHVIETFSPEELALVAQVKRFFECVQGDPGLRADIESGTVRPEQAERLKRIGVSFDLDEVALLREEPEAVGHFLGGLRCSRSCEPPDEVPEIFRGSCDLVSNLDLRWQKPIESPGHADKKNPGEAAGVVAGIRGLSSRRSSQ